MFSPSLGELGLGRGIAGQKICVEVVRKRRKALTEAREDGEAAECPVVLEAWAGVAEARDIFAGLSETDLRSRMDSYSLSF
jgi:hypothetical protein